MAYVLAHEIGHHVQTILRNDSTSRQNAQSGHMSEGEMNRTSVATELQADFYAGLWAKQTDNREKFLDPQDLKVLWKPQQQ